MNANAVDAVSLAARCLLWWLSVVAGGWQSRNLSQSATCSSSCCLISVSVVSLSVWFARAAKSTTQFETSTKPFKLLFAFVALFDFCAQQRRGRWQRQGQERGATPSLPANGLQPFAQNFALDSKREKPRRESLLQNSR